MKDYFIFFSCCCFLALTGFKRAYAQDAPLIINGKVVSADDHQPVAYASIGIPGQGIGTMSNANGDFVFRLSKASPVDSLQVSCVGFKTKTIALSGFSRPGEQAILVLTKSNTELQTVSIAYRDPMKIIQKAIDRIPENYIAKPHVVRGFYRETTRKDKTPLQLSEAVFDIYNYGYGDSRPDLFRLVKARDTKNQRDFHGIEVGQKPREIFTDDIVKQLESSDILGTEGIKRHDYEVKGIVDFKGRPTYEITFSEKPGEKDKTYRGSVFIDTKSYAFVYFDYGLSPEGMKNAKLGSLAQRMMMKTFGMEVSIRADRNRVSYQQFAGKWIFAGVAGNTDLYIKLPRFNYDFVAKVKFDYVVTQTDTTQTIPFEEKMRPDENIIDHDTNEGEAFWKDYNILLPDYDTEALFRQIDAINAIVRLKNKFIAIEQKMPKDPALRIDSMLTFYHAAGQFNGTALIQFKGKVILTKSYGYADKEKQLTAGEHTTYRIGSLSKSFTSVIINQLIAEDKIDVNVPVKTYLPWYKNGEVTISQLLTHQSGIPDYFNKDDYKLQLTTQSFTLKEVVEKFCSDTLEFKSGSQFSYSNSNFTVLALVAQAVTGQPLETLLQQRIFTPLQLTDTYFGTDKGNNSHQAIGYPDGAKEITYDAGNTYGAGGISSSAADLLKFHAALLTGKLLPKAQLDTMLKPRVEFKDYNAYYDYGWMTDKSAFSASQHHTVSYHPGTDLGFYTMFVREPDANSCIILLNNTGSFPRYDLADLILDLLN